MEWIASFVSGFTEIKLLFGEVMQQQISQHTVAFIIAWQLVKRDMKKGLKSEFAKLADAIESVGLSLAKLGNRVDVLESKHNLQGGKDGTAK